MRQMRPLPKMPPISTTAIGNHVRQHPRIVRGAYYHCDHVQCEKQDDGNDGDDDALQRRRGSWDPSHRRCHFEGGGVAVWLRPLPSREKAILFCWQIVLLFVLSFLSRPAIFVWGRTFLLPIHLYLNGVSLIPFISDFSR